MKLQLPIENPDVVALARLRATVVDPGAQLVPDEAAIGQEAQGGGIPGPEMGLLCVAIIAMAALRRRRSC